MTPLSRRFIAKVLRTHLRVHFEEFFVSMPSETEHEVLLGVVNHVSSWDAELLMLATLPQKRSFMMLADDHVIAAHPSLKRLGMIGLGATKTPTEAVREVVDRARAIAPSVLWVMPQRSHWPLHRTNHIEHAAAVFGRHLGQDATRFANLRYDFNAARRPFVSLCVGRSEALMSSTRPSRDAWLNALKDADQGHGTAESAGSYIGMLRPGRYSHTSGVPTPVAAVEQILENTPARVLGGSPLRIERNGVTAEDLETFLRPLGLDRAASLAESSRA